MEEVLNMLLNQENDISTVDDLCDVL